MLCRTQDDERCAILSSMGNRIRNRLPVIFGLMFFIVSCTFAQTARTIQVDVTYTGSGKVDASHKIYVALWDSADTNAGPPAALKSLEAKKGTVTFSDVQKAPAFVSVAYDPTGKWQAQSPPPSGSSVAMYSEKPPQATPINVAPGKTARVKLTFDDKSKVP